MLLLADRERFINKLDFDCYMGLENIREVSGSVLSGVFGGLPIRDFVAELVAPNREKIDYTTPVKLGSYSLVTEMGDFDKDGAFVLPTESYDRIERVLRLPLNRSMQRSLRDANVYAHEYLKNPEVLTLICDHSVRICEDRDMFDRPDRYEVKCVDAQRELSRTLAHLAGGRLHLFHRRKQFSDRPELQELFDKIDKVQLPEMYRKRKRDIEYWS